MNESCKILRRQNFTLYYPSTHGCFRSHLPFTPVFTLHGWLARHSGCLEKRNCHNCRNYFRLFPFAADWMENGVCENLSRPRQPWRGTTQHRAFIILCRGNREMKETCEMLECFYCTLSQLHSKHLSLWWWHVLLLPLLMFMWPHDMMPLLVQIFSSVHLQLSTLFRQKIRNFLINYCTQ